jgi:hypothetical protein
LQTTSSTTKLLLKHSYYANIFLEEEANTLLDKHAWHYAIKLIKSYNPLYSLIYYLLEKELVVLKDYISSSLKKE